MSVAAVVLVTSPHACHEPFPCGGTFMFKHAIGWAVTVFLCTQVCQGNDWPRFRGPNGTGISTDKGLPTSLDPKSNLVWKVAAPRGVSSPVIVKGRVFFTSYADEDRTTHCLDALTGKTLWTRTEKRTRREIATPPSGPATPTPVAWADGVAVFFPDIGIISYRTNGDMGWRRELKPFHSMHGVSSSLTLAGDRVILVADQLQDSFIAAYELSTGQPLWRQQRPDGLTGGYSTPSVVESRGITQLVVTGPLELVGYDAATGKRQWWISGLTNAPVSLPVVVGNRVLLCEPVGEPLSLSESEFAEYDKDKDGKVQFSEVEDVALSRLMARIDRDGNRDKAVDSAELKEAFGTFVDRGGLVSIKLGGTGDVTKTNIGWSYRRSLPHVPSVLAYGDVVYFVQNGGILTSLNGKNGEVLKRGRLKAGGQYYSSPVGGDGKVFLVNTSGRASVVQEGGQWELLATNDLAEACHATPAIWKGRVYVRTDNSLFCFGAPVIK